MSVWLMKTSPPARVHQTDRGNQYENDIETKYGFKIATFGAMSRKICQDSGEYDMLSDDCVRIVAALRRSVTVPAASRAC
ncbi:hypothetical protein ACUSIJ_17145 [Pseudochelatococcus sp. B33]